MSGELRSPSNATQAATAVIDTLLAERAKGATICPSEVARRLNPDDWREQMPIVHEAVAGLAARGQIVVTWRGVPITPGPGTGPYRVGRQDKS